MGNQGVNALPCALADKAEAASGARASILQNERANHVLVEAVGKVTSTAHITGA